jgi:hypothetical protein
VTLPIRLLAGLAVLTAVALPALPAQGQTVSGTTRIAVDTPTEGATVTNGTQILIGGWAVDTAGPGTGVDQMRVYLDNPMDSGGRLLGTADYGVSRADVAASLGTAAFTSSGFNYLWTPSGLTGGSHTLYVYAHSIANGWVSKTVTVTAPAQPTATATPPGGQYGPSYGPGHGYGGPEPLPPVRYPPPGGFYGPGPFPPPFPGYPAYPSYPRNPGTGDSNGLICIQIYPPPPGC